MFRKTLILTVLTIILLHCVHIQAVPLIPGSAFDPEVQPYSGLSIVGDQDSVGDDIGLVRPGLQHPFRTWKGLRGAVLEALSPGTPKRSILRYAWQGEGLELKTDLNIVAGYEYKIREQGNYGFLYKGLRLRNVINDRLFLSTRWWNGGFFGDLDSAANDPLIDSWHKVNPDRITLDNLSADLSYRVPHLGLSLGRSKFNVTNSFSGSIVLGDKVNEYGYLMAEGSLGRFTLSMLQGALVADSIYVENPSTPVNLHYYPDKFLALHQLSYAAGGGVQLFAGETVIYGNRGLDLNYLIPVSFWRAAEHNLRDRDNVMIYGGMNYKPSPDLVIYLQGALDELSYSKLLTNWWGNKYALQTGLQAALPRLYQSGGKSPVLNLELTAVRPWTYAHYMNHTMYSHDRRPLGYSKGSNLVDLSVGLKLPLPLQTSLQSSASFTRQGSFGSSWQENYAEAFPGQQQYDGTAEWFEGNRTDKIKLQNILSIDLMAHHRLRLGLSSEHIENWKHDLSAGWQFSF